MVLVPNWVDEFPPLAIYNSSGGACGEGGPAEGLRVLFPANNPTVTQRGHPYQRENHMGGIQRRLLKCTWSHCQAGLNFCPSNNEAAKQHNLSGSPLVWIAVNPNQLS